jgi:hypothetical protein
MLTAAVVVALVGTNAPPSDGPPAARTPPGWELTKAPDSALTWAAPRGWKLSTALPTGAAPSSLSFQPAARAQDGWLNVHALVSGNASAEELLAKRPEGITHITTEDGWSCGEEPGPAAAAVCATAGDVVTLVVEMGGGSSRSLSRVGGVAALRRAARLIHGVWPKGLPQPDPAGHLPPVEWTAASTLDGHITWSMPRGWTALEETGKSGEARPSMLSFNATAGTGGFSITALPGLKGASLDQLPVAEERVIKLLVPEAEVTRDDDWTCGEGVEKSSGLPAIICTKLTQKLSLYVSVRAEPVVFQTLGGVAAVRAAATQVKGF